MSVHQRFAIALLTALIVAGTAGAQATQPAHTRPTPAKPASHTIRGLEGWTVHIDDRLLDETHQELGDRALKLLANRLADIVRVVPADKVERLGKVPIWLDLPPGRLASAHFPPPAG